MQPRKSCLKYLMYYGMSSYTVQSLNLHCLDLSCGVKCGTLKTACEQLFQSNNVFIFVWHILIQDI